MTKIEAQFKTALDKAFGLLVAGFTFEHLARSINSPQGGFIVTSAKNIRCSGDAKKRRVTALLTVVRGPNFDREFKAKYVLTFDNNRKPSYKANITEIK